MLNLILLIDGKFSNSCGQLASEEMQPFTHFNKFHNMQNKSDKVSFDIAKCLFAG